MRKHTIYIIAIGLLIAALGAHAGSYLGQRPEITSEIDCLINDCNLLSGEIDLLEYRMSDVEEQLDLLDADITIYDDTLKQITDSIIMVNEEVARLLVQARKNRYRLSETDALFSSQPVAQMIRRAGYINQQLKNSGAELKSLHSTYFFFRDKRDRIADIQDNEETLYASLDNINDQLWDKRDQLEELQKTLLKDKEGYNRAMDLRVSRADTLNRRVVYLVASNNPPAKKSKKNDAPAPAKKADKPSDKNAKGAKASDDGTKDNKSSDKNAKDAQPSDKEGGGAKTDEKPVEKTDPETRDFEAKRGALPSPVDGRYVVVGRFGNQSVPDYPKVKLYNPGVDLEVDKGAKARVVSDGKVVSIFRTSGYHTVVIVRHGEYFTVYGGIDKLSVKTGESVKVGQSLGTLYSDQSDKNRTIMHFEVRQGSRGLNPVDWLKK